MRRRHHLLVCLAAPALVLGVLGVPTETSATEPADRSVPVVAPQVEPSARVALPRVRWDDCWFEQGMPEKLRRRYECAVLRVPLDYDEPRGATTPIHVTRLKAEKRRAAGSVFVNPGGPGGDAAFFTFAIKSEFPDVAERFDIIGVDPRGTGLSGRTVCKGPLPDVDDEDIQVGFPVTPQQVRAAVAVDDSIRKACRDDASDLVKHASTADVARDMDLVRRVLHERTLTYYGISYGSYLGATYAAMFPNRVRAMVVDGVLDPVAWSTGPAHRKPRRPFSYRLRSGYGAYEALTAAFAECDRVGRPRCALADSALDRWNGLLDAARAGLLVDGDYPVRYQDLVSTALGALYDHGNVHFLTDYLADLDDAVSSPRTLARGETVDVSGIRHHQRLVRLRERLEARGPYTAPEARPARNIRWDVTFAAVTCSDSRNPNSPRAWETSSRLADQRTPWFGRSWTWASSLCARQGVGSAADAFRGPWRTRTPYPLLVVGNSHDPATPASGARRVNQLFEDSVFVLNDSWGHGALGGSPCITDLMSDYLTGRTLPPDGTVCRARPLFTR